MDTAEILLLSSAGLVAGAMNAAAGGGSFLTLPALISAGVPAVQANASSTVALFPGAVASVVVYRKDFAAFNGISIRQLLLVSVLGGLVGALLLLITPAKTFVAIVPWLMLIGAIAFAYGRHFGLILQRWLHLGQSSLLCAQFLLGVYGGYFGGAVGIMMMAVWGMFGITDIKVMNPTKTLLVGATNAVAVICFMMSGMVCWPQTLVMLFAAMAGGHGGAVVARLIPAERLRLGITIFNFVITGIFLWRSFA